MVAQGEHELMANRSDRRLPTLISVRAHWHEADRMIRDPGARISIRARAAFYAAHHTGRIYDRNRFPQPLLTPCARAGSIYDRRGTIALFRRFPNKFTNSQDDPRARLIFSLTLKTRH
jgi:hypothetical protein